MERYEGVSDEELLRRYQEGEEGILDYLMDKYKGLVRGKARALFLMGGDTDDLIQEGMIGLFKAVRDYREDRQASFVTFANLCIERQMYHAIQSSHRQKNLPLNSYVSLDQESSLHLPVVNPEAIVIDQENARALEEFVAEHLSRMENEVLSHYLQGENYEEIAVALQKTPKAIDNALQRIRRKLGGYLLGKGRERAQS